MVAGRPKITIMFPSSRTQKIMSQVKRLSSPSDNIAEQQEQERVLTFDQPVPTPLALPSILKRKYADSPGGESLVAKSKRVNFSNPCTTSTKVFIREQTEVSEEDINNQSLEVSRVNLMVTTKTEPVPVGSKIRKNKHYGRPEAKEKIVNKNASNKTESIHMENTDEDYSTKSEEEIKPKQLSFRRMSVILANNSRKLQSSPKKLLPTRKLAQRGSIEKTKTLDGCKKLLYIDLTKNNILSKGMTSSATTKETVRPPKATPDISSSLSKRIEKKALTDSRRTAATQFATPTSESSETSLPEALPETRNTCKRTLNSTSNISPIESPPTQSKFSSSDAQFVEFEEDDINSQSFEVSRVNQIETTKTETVPVGSKIGKTKPYRKTGAKEKIVNKNDSNKTDSINKENIDEDNSTKSEGEIKSKHLRFRRMSAILADNSGKMQSSPNKRLPTRKLARCASVEKTITVDGCKKLLYIDLTKNNILSKGMTSSSTTKKTVGPSKATPDRRSSHTKRIEKKALTDSRNTAATEVATPTSESSDTTFPETSPETRNTCNRTLDSTSNISPIESPPPRSQFSSSDDQFVELEEDPMESQNNARSFPSSFVSFVASLLRVFIRNMDIQD